MWSIIGSFISKKVFTETGGFTIAALVVFGMLLIPNIDNIMSKLGFETEASIKAELARTQEELKQLKQINDRLVNRLDEVTKVYEDQINAILEAKSESVVVDNYVKTIKNVKNKKDKKITKQLNSKTKIKDKTIEIPIEEMDQLSANNIDAINQVYDNLFT